MKCSHCGMSSNSKGKHMSRDIWKAGMALAQNYNDHIVVGGGEPTLHPDFWEIIGLCMGKFDYVWMATNGSQTETALALANLARKGALGVALSQDAYHDPIDPEVIQAFTGRKRIYHSDYKENDPDSREIRDVTGKEIKAGRCKIGEDSCVCSDIMIMEDGTIRGCACKDAPYLGTVFNPNIPSFWQDGECSKKQTDEDDHS